MSTKAQRKSNKSRRERYATDEEYRRRVVEAKRLRYRAKVMKRGGKVRNCLARLPYVTVYGRTRRVLGIDKPVLTFSVTELAALLGYHPVVVRNWAAKGKFPKGPCTSLEFPFNNLYLREHVERIVKIIGEVQKTTQNFYDADTDITGLLYDAVMKPTHDDEKESKSSRGAAGKTPAAFAKEVLRPGHTDRRSRAKGKWGLSDFFAGG